MQKQTPFFSDKAVVKERTKSKKTELKRRRKAEVRTIILLNLNFCSFFSFIFELISYIRIPKFFFVTKFLNNFVCPGNVNTYLYY